MAYRLAASGVLAMALGTVALLLQGCGRSSGGQNDATHAFELVSQTFNGTITMSSATPGVPSPKIATMEFGLDMEAVRFHQKTHIVMEVPLANITSDVVSHSIFDAATKRYTMFHNATTKAPVPTPPTPATCVYYELTKLPAPATVAKCVRDAAAMLKSTGSDHGLDMFEVHVPPVMNVSVDEHLYSDGSHVLKKIVTTTTVTGPHATSQKMEIVDMNAKAGAPEQDFFKVPAEWGTCVKAETPAVPAAADNPVALAFLVCMGMHDGQAVLTV